MTIVSIHITTNIIGFWKYRLANIKRNSKQNIKFNLDLDFLLDLWYKQSGKCFYSGTDMLTTPRGNGIVSKNEATVDRFDPSKGYTKENIVLCTYHFNTMKSNLSFNEFLDLSLDIVKTRSEVICENKD